MRRAISNTKKLVVGKSLTEGCLEVTQYPASGSYIDVSGYRTVDIIIHLGTVAADVAFEVKQTDAADGELVTISETYCLHTIDNTTDDGQLITFHLETDQLTEDSHFITVDVSAATTGDFADILFLLGGARHLPVTQTTALLPAASQYIFAG